MSIIWLIGFLFTMGILLDGDDSKTPWYTSVFCTVLCFITWPMYLGRLCSGFFATKKGS